MPMQHVGWCLYLPVLTAVETLRQLDGDSLGYNLGARLLNDRRIRAGVIPRLRTVAGVYRAARLAIAFHHRR